MSNHAIANQSGKVGHYSYCEDHVKLTASLDGRRLVVEGNLITL
jgi:hypothetical protein